MEIDVIGGPGSLISSRMAVCQQDPILADPDVHEESCLHPTQTEPAAARAIVSRPRHVNSSAAEMGDLTAGGALMGCIANSCKSALFHHWTMINYLIALEVEMANSLGPLDLVPPYIPVVSTVDKNSLPSRLCPSRSAPSYPTWKEIVKLTQYRVYKSDHWIHHMWIS